MKALPTLRQLTFLVALADKRHFARAADSCLVSQSTLSGAIQELETTLGVALFERSRRSVTPTTIGMEIIARARTLLKDAGDMVDAALAARAPLSGPLRLGVIPTIGPFLLPRLLPRIREAAPELRVYLREEQTAGLLERMDAGLIDAAILALPISVDAMETQEVALDPFVVVCPHGHRLANLPIVRSDDLATEDLLLLEDGHCMREHALAACALEGARRNIAFQGTSLLTLVQMVANGVGVTLVPRMAIDAGLVRGLDLHVADLHGDAPHRRIALAWRRTSGRRDTFDRLVWLLRGVMEERQPALEERPA